MSPRQAGNEVRTVKNLGVLGLIGLAVVVYYGFKWGIFDAIVSALTTATQTH